MKKKFEIIFTFLFALSVRADVIAPRFKSNCAFSFNKLYCYGGKLNNNQYSNDIYALDLNSLSPGPVSDMVNNWTLITVNPSTSIPQDEYRFDSQFIPLPNGSLFFDGGYNEDHPLVARNATYDPQKNVWTVLSGDSYNDAQNGGYRQIYAAGAVHLPDTNSIAFYGGKQLNAVLGYNYTSFRTLDNLTYETTSNQSPTKQLVESIYGYNYVTELNLNTRLWTSRDTVPLVVNDFPILISGQTATYHPGTKAIIYLGGVTTNQLLQGSLGSFNNFLSYDTQSSLWNLKPTNGLNTPTARIGHTATMLSTQNNILVYGGSILPENGASDGELVSDYLYDFDVSTFTWSLYNEQFINLGPRTFHSAVLANGTTLFIMFGKTKSKNTGLLVGANDIMVLNVTDRSSFTSLNTYPLSIASTTNKTSTDGQSDNQNNNKSTGLSGGAIAGIVVGVVATIFIVAFAVFYHTKKKYKEKMNELHVDWDKLDGEYREVSPAGFSADSVNLNSTVSPPVVFEKPSESLNAYSSSSADSKLIKPDVHQDFQMNIKPDAILK